MPSSMQATFKVKLVKFKQDGKCINSFIRKDILFDKIFKNTIKRLLIHKQ